MLIVAVLTTYVKNANGHYYIYIPMRLPEHCLDTEYMTNTFKRTFDEYVLYPMENIYTCIRIS